MWNFHVELSCETFKWNFHLELSCGIFMINYIGYIVELQTFSKLASERVQALPIDLRYIYKRVLTGRQPWYIADIYLVVPALAWHSLGRWFWKGFQHYWLHNTETSSTTTSTLVHPSGESSYCCFCDRQVFVVVTFLQLPELWPLGSFLFAHVSLA